MARILVAEDDPLLVQMVVDRLAAMGYAVDVANRGDDALAFIQQYSFDLLILDWNMPGATGLEICRSFRQMGHPQPVLFLTAKSDVSDKEMGLESGADDYLTKPFDMRELAARVRSLLRRPPQYAGNTLQVGDLELDIDSRQLSCNGTLLRLQPRELALLEFFMRRPGQVIGSEALLSGVWGSDFDGSEIALRSCLTKLRKALSQVQHANIIETVHGFGYRMKPAEEHKQVR